MLLVHWLRWLEDDRTPFPPELRRRLHQQLVADNGGSMPPLTPPFGRPIRRGTGREVMRQSLKRP